MEKQWKQHGVWIVIVVSALAAAALLLSSVPTANAARETFSNQCSSGTIEVWVSHVGPGMEGYFTGSRSVSVEYSYPESSPSGIVDVTFVAVSTGQNCSRVEVRTRTRRSQLDAPTPPPSPTPQPTPLPTPSLRHVQDGDGDTTPLEFTRPNGDRHLLQRSDGSVVRDSPDVALELRTPDGTNTCHGGRYYYGINDDNTTWATGCMSPEDVADSNAKRRPDQQLDAGDSSTTAPDLPELRATLVASLPPERREGTKYRLFDMVSTSYPKWNERTSRYDTIWGPNVRKQVRHTVCISDDNPWPGMDVESEPCTLS